MGPPPGHFYGVWDDTAGVRVVFEHMDMLDLGFPIGADDVDRNGDPVDPSVVGLYSMGLTPETHLRSDARPHQQQAHRRGVGARGLVVEPAALGHGLEHRGPRQADAPPPRVPRVPARAAITRRSLDFYADRIDESAIPTEDTPGMLVTFERGSLDEKSRWEYKDTSDFITSPTFAPRLDPGGRYKGPNPGGHDGYVVLPVQNDRGFRVEVFDAANVGAGPVAVASAPNGRTVPALLHAAWMPHAVSAVDAERMSFASELDDAVLATLDADIAGVTRQIAADLDEA